MKKKKLIITLISIVVFLLLCALGCYVYLGLQISPLAKNKSVNHGNNVNNSNQSVSVEIESENAGIQEIRFEIDYGTSVYSISQELEKKNVIKNGKFFYYFIRYPDLFAKFYKNKIANSQEELSEILSGIDLKSGIYFLTPDMKYSEIVINLSSGRQEYVKVSIPEGLTISKIGEILEANDVCLKSDFKQACYSVENLVKYKIPGESLEGFLFPDTYYFNHHMEVNAVVDMMIQNFMEKVSQIEELKGKTFHQMYDTIKLASIVEREYRIPEEAPLIASVFTNRLRHNIGLYSCATVEYILTEIKGRPHADRILIEDTRIDNPYNTYVWAGLPPGPISNPGMIALRAAANPPKTKYYFFQIADVEAGRHVFSQTFDEHKVNHNLYTKK